jgi:hypothetical protein
MLYAPNETDRVLPPDERDVFDFYAYTYDGEPAYIPPAWRGEASSPSLVSELGAALTNLRRRIFPLSEED